MTKLTRNDQHVLSLTGNAVRMYVALITFVFPILAVIMANRQYGLISYSGRQPEIPPAATYGTIVGIYMPMFGAAAAYIWATRAFPERQQAPQGFGMAVFRDLFTILVVTVMLFMPVLLYASANHIQTVNTFLVWYQSVATAVAGGAFTYYFHGSLNPGDAKNARTERRRKPRAQPRATAAVAAAE